MKNVDTLPPPKFSPQSSGFASLPLKYYELKPVLAEAGVSLGLGGILHVGIVKQVLYAQQDLLDGNCRPPVLFLIQYGETDFT